MDIDRSEATKRGLEAARKRGRVLGRKPTVSDAMIAGVMHLGTAEACRRVGLSKAQFLVRRRRIERRADT